MSKSNKNHKSQTTKHDQATKTDHKKTKVEKELDTTKNPVMKNISEKESMEIPMDQEVATKEMLKEAEVKNEEIVKEIPMVEDTEADIKENKSDSEQILEDDYAPIKIDKKISKVKKPETKEDYLYESEEEKPNNLLLKTIFLIAALALLGYFILGVGNGGSKPIPQNNTPVTNTPVDKKPCINNNQKMDIPKNLIIEDTLVGTGKEVFSGCQIKIHYKGTLLPADGETEGKKFDSSFDRGTPFTTQIGVGKLIKGWDIGIVGMKEGGKRKLTIPAELAYGDIELPGIPAKSTLVFEVELIQVME